MVVDQVVMSRYSFRTGSGWRVKMKKSKNQPEIKFKIFWESVFSTTLFFAFITSEYERVHLNNIIERNWDFDECRDWKFPEWKSTAPEEDDPTRCSNNETTVYQTGNKHEIQNICSINMLYCKKACVP